MDYSKYDGYTKGTHKVGNWNGSSWVIWQDENSIEIGRIIRIEDAELYADAPKLLARCLELEKALAYVREECEDCKASSDPTASQCAICETGRVLKELDK